MSPLIIKIKKYISSFEQMFSRKIILLSSMLLFGAVAVMIVLVFSRYLFSYSFPWSEELTRYLIVYSALLTCAVLVRERDHITVTYFFEHLPLKVQYFLRLFFDVCIFMTMIIWIFVGFDTAFFMKVMLSGGLGISMLWPYLAIPISGILLCFFVVLNFIEDLRNNGRIGDSTSLEGKEQKK
jgi:TRAP-type transport system small permease protein